MDVMPSLLNVLRTELKKVADPKKASQMRAYMKSTMPYHGVQNPLLRKACKKVFADLEFQSQKAWEGEVLQLWRKARFREERYAALHLAAHRCARGYQNPDAMKMYEEMIETGAWWDYVDDLASHKVGPIVKAHPRILKPKMRSWSRSGNFWKRRTSIICQLGFKRETDREFLYACIEPSLGSKEFFLQKAIGWALRQYAWVDPKEVLHYVRKMELRMSSLSKREALKNIGRD